MTHWTMPKHIFNYPENPILFFFVEDKRKKNYYFLLSIILDYSLYIFDNEIKKAPVIKCFTTFRFLPPQKAVLLLTFYPLIKIFSPI